MKRAIQLGLLLILCLRSTQPAFSQKEANVWYFGNHAGLDFNTGEPRVLTGMTIGVGSCASISDSDGNFLFATNGRNIWNRDKEVMPNGDNIKGHPAASQAELIVPKPGSENIYYVFTTAHGDGDPWDYGLYYSVVDMALDGGLGDVTAEKNILLTDAYDAAEKIVGVRKEGSQDIWVITRKFYEDGFAAFLLSPSGINTTAVFSPSVDRRHEREEGNIKISHDKKRLAAAYRTDLGTSEKPDVEICNFNALTGEVELLYVINYINDTGCYAYEPWGVEFSPDSKWLYLSFYSECSNSNHVSLLQYDMRYYEDSALFVDTKVLIGPEVPALGLQLAADGKIYTTSPTYGSYDYVSVVHDPWKKGTACNFEADAIDLGLGEVGQFLPNVLLDYLFRFEWEGNCSAGPFVFQSNFQPEPAVIRWNFSDPAAGADSVSTELNPVHYFTDGGEFEVTVVVQYPSGRVEKTSRVVTVIGTPHPDLGPDTLKCELGVITLNAGNEEGMYAWSTGAFGQNMNELTVADSGWYWVQVTGSGGCRARDSVYVGIFPKAEVNEDNLTLVPTSCGGSNGKILGLLVSGEVPLSYQWYNADSLLVSTTLDCENLGVGNYYLHILDNNGCTTITPAYTITDAGDIQFASVEKQDTHCGQPIGSVTITVSNANSEDLFYSIDNGTSYLQDNPVFTNLAPGSYYIRVKDGSGCEGVYENNPVIVQDIAGPKVTNTSTANENDYLQNGQIDITATTPQGQTHYSIDNGTSFQAGDGHFTNLGAGTYLCVVKDGYKCDTGFVVEVDRDISQLIGAIVGDGTTCIGNAAVVPLRLKNFTGIYKFHVKLTYDTSLLNCDGYTSAHPLLETGLQVSIVPATDEVIVSWQGVAPVTLEENATLLELVFGAKKQGFSGIDWAATAGECVFYNENLDRVNADYTMGVLRVYTRPGITMGSEREVCEGERLVVLPYIEGGSGSVSYFWQGPGGFESTGVMVDIPNATSQSTGIYTLTVTDAIGCTESKSLELQVLPGPQIAFSGQDTIFAEAGFILEAGNGAQSYLWNTGDTTGTIRVDEEGLYVVYVTGARQCKSSDSVTVLWDGEAFWLPTAFTPNRDGLNDEFKPVQRYDYVNTYRMTVYGRWGGLVFETNDINTGWDGMHKGVPAPGGTYVYRVVYTAWQTKDEQQLQTGVVTLIR